MVQLYAFQACIKGSKLNFVHMHSQYITELDAIGRWSRQFQEFTKYCQLEYAWLTESHLRVQLQQVVQHRHRHLAEGRGFACPYLSLANFRPSVGLQEAYMMFLLMKEIAIMKSQLGTMAKAQKTYPRGTARPY